MNEQPLNDAELAAALQNLDFEAAAQLIEKQTQLRAAWPERQKALAAAAAEAEAKAAAEAELQRQAEERVRQQLEQKRLAEEQARIAAEQSRLAEERAREIAERAKKEEEERLAEQARVAELERLAQIERFEEAQRAEQAKQAETAKHAEEAAEAARIAEMTRIAEANRLAAEQFATSAETAQVFGSAEPTPPTSQEEQARANFQALLGDYGTPYSVASNIPVQDQEEFSGIREDDTLGGLIADSDTPIKVTGPVIHIPSAESHLSSAEELVTAEQENKIDADNFVDDLIVSVGGEIDDETEPETNKTKETKNAASLLSLLGSWNGSGALFTLVGVGFGFAASNGSFGSLLLGGFVALVLVGLAASVAAIAARRGKLPQQVLSRATFGVTGNLVPALVLTLGKVVAIATMLLILSQSIVVMLPQQGIPSKIEFALVGFPTSLPTIPMIAYGLALVAFIFSFFKGTALSVVRVLTTTLTLLLIVMLVVLGETSGMGLYRNSFGYDTVQALGLASSILIIFALLWGSTAADENTRISPNIIGAKLIAAGTLNWLVLGALALTAGYIAHGLTWGQSGSNLIAVIAIVLFVFALATAVSQTTSASSGIRVPNPGAGIALIVVVLATVAAGFLFDRLGTEGVWANLVSYLPVIGVPVVAWLGIFCSDVVLRKVNYHSVSLERNYGFYRGWNFTNLIGWLAISAIGLGLISSELPEFGWVGYIASVVGLNSMAIAANVGVWVALVLGFIYPFATGIKRIRKQEAEVIALDARREELKDVALSGEYA